MEHHIFCKFVPKKIGELTVRNYNELAKYITSLISPKDVEKLSLILGYAMAKTIKNKIIDCLEALNKYFENIEIIVKNDGSNQKIDDSIKESIVEED